MPVPVASKAVRQAKRAMRQPCREDVEVVAQPTGAWTLQWQSEISVGGGESQFMLRRTI
ncbi:hypothetical protein [Neoroseomonas rubea]|uniref:hypothetical protein n=1 Tax=Neoroseomonas rubea TaxID=2748666 RepID=UPI0018DF8A3F|nr:hypothetical protein [Roseomonas rubea]